MKKTTAIVIGAGIGGLGTAIQLSKAGFDVTVFEKHNRPGGRCGQIVKDGHIFDTGPTMYLFPEIYSKFFSSIGEDINKHLKLLRCDPTYLVSFPDNRTLNLRSDLDEMKSQFETIEPGSYREFRRLLEYSKKYYDFAMSEITEKNLRKPFDYFNLKNLYFLLKHGALINHYFFIKRFFKNPLLRAALTFQDSYLGLSPFKATALFSTLSYAELTYGNYLPEGGMYSIIMALEKIAKKNGVKIIYSKEVKKIVTNDHQATGVVFDDGSSEKAEYIIVNADLSFAYDKLLSGDPYAKKLEHKKYSCSAIVFHWGLDKTYSSLNTHNIFFSEDYKQRFNDVVDRPYPPVEPHFYIQAPSRIDPDRAPKKQDTLTVMVPINHIYPSKPVDWKKYILELRTYILKRLDRAGFTDIANHIKFEVCYGPEDWKNDLNLINGSIYGLHHNISQIGYLRSKRTHSKYNNLFFVGASSHPGSGLPTVLLSSQFTAQSVIEHRKME